MELRNRIVERRQMPLRDILPHAGNPKDHPEGQRKALRGVLEEIGWAGAALAYYSARHDGALTLIDAHLRRDEVPADFEADVLITDLSDEEADRLLLVYDPIAAMAELNREKVAELLANRQNGAVGKLMEEVARRAGVVLEQPPEDPGPQIDRAEELQQKWQVKTGDVWELGDHRVICGDCTDREVVERVMGGDKARMAFVDPPYGIGKEIENDNLKGDKLIDFYRCFTDVVLSHCIENAYVYVWGYFDTLSNYWQLVLKERGDCNFRNFIIWRKKNIQGRNAEDFRQYPEEYEAALLFIFGQPFQNGPWSTSPNAEYYPVIFEPIRAYLDDEREKMGWDIPTVKKMVGHSDLSGDHWFGRSQWTMPTEKVYSTIKKAAHGRAFCKEYDELRKEYDELRKEYDELRGHFDNSFGFTDLWELDTHTTTGLHPTEKPLEAAERAIKTNSKKGEFVTDPFLGSGTTLIACERLGRQCRGVEIDPKYIAVTLERWHTMTGREPVRL